MNFDLKTYLDRRRMHIEEALGHIFPTSDNAPRVVQAMTYSLMAGGKRLRPILCIAACEAVGGDPEAAVPVGCAIELIHTYSLIHDDLPAMDNDRLRRGKPTCHVAFDEATAILAGDALLTHAFSILADPREIGYYAGDSLPSASLRLQLIAIVSKAAGHSGMVEGQMRDMLLEGRQPATLESLERMHRLKTGAMIEASVACGVLIGGGTDADIDRLRTYACHIGLAFQIQDDILNVEGDPRIMGKAAGTDDLRKKTTYPSLLGLDAAKSLAIFHRDQALTVLSVYDAKADPLRALADYIVHRNR